MTKPASYPFLAIAKRYRLDYGDVLTVADFWRRGSRPTELNERNMPALHNAVLWPHEAHGGITFANADFRAIQAGKIDWETGAVSAITGDFDTRRKLDLMKPLKTPLLDATTLKPLNEGWDKAAISEPDFGEAEPGEHAEIIDALNYRNHDDE